MTESISQKTRVVLDRRIPRLAKRTFRKWCLDIAAQKPEDQRGTVIDVAELMNQEGKPKADGWFRSNYINVLEEELQ